MFYFSRLADFLFWYNRNFIIFYFNRVYLEFPGYFILLNRNLGMYLFSRFEYFSGFALLLLYSRDFIIFCHNRFFYFNRFLDFFVFFNRNIIGLNFSRFTDFILYFNWNSDRIYFNRLLNCNRLFYIFFLFCEAFEIMFFFLSFFIKSVIRLFLNSRSVKLQFIHFAGIAPCGAFSFYPNKIVSFQAKFYKLI